MLAGCYRLSNFNNVAGRRLMMADRFPGEPPPSQAPTHRSISHSAGTRMQIHLMNANRRPVSGAGMTSGLFGRKHRRWSGCSSACRASWRALSQILTLLLFLRCGPDSARRKSLTSCLWGGESLPGRVKVVQKKNAALSRLGDRSIFAVTMARDGHADGGKLQGGRCAVICANVAPTVSTRFNYKGMRDGAYMSLTEVVDTCHPAFTRPTESRT